MPKFNHDSTKADSCETRVVVVAGGAAGIELSMAMRARWGCRNVSDNSTTKTKLSITLLDSNDELMPGESIACREAMKKIMDKYHIEIMLFDQGEQQLVCFIILLDTCILLTRHLFFCQQTYPSTESDAFTKCGLQ